MAYRREYGNPSRTMLDGWASPDRSLHRFVGCMNQMNERPHHLTSAAVILQEIWRLGGDIKEENEEGSERPRLMLYGHRSFPDALMKLCELHHRELRDYMRTQAYRIARVAKDKLA